MSVFERLSMARVTICCAAPKRIAYIRICDRVSTCVKPGTTPARRNIRPTTALSMPKAALSPAWATRMPLIGTEVGGARRTTKGTLVSDAPISPNSSTVPTSPELDGDSSVAPEEEPPLPAPASPVVPAAAGRSRLGQTGGRSPTVVVVWAALVRSADGASLSATSSVVTGGGVPAVVVVVSSGSGKHRGTTCGSRQPSRASKATSPRISTVLPMIVHSNRRNRWYSAAMCA